MYLRFAADADVVPELSNNEKAGVLVGCLFVAEVVVSAGVVADLVPNRPSGFSPAAVAEGAGAAEPNRLPVGRLEKGDLVEAEPETDCAPLSSGLVLAEENPSAGVEVVLFFAAPKRPPPVWPLEPEARLAKEVPNGLDEEGAEAEAG